MPPQSPSASSCCIRLGTHASWIAWIVRGSQVPFACAAAPHSHVEDLPGTQAPEVFGLHANAGARQAT